MTDIKIPPEVVKAAARAMCCTNGECKMTKRTCNSYLMELDASRAVHAALNAWPGATRIGSSGGGVSQEPVSSSRLILPLPQEKSE